MKSADRSAAAIGAHVRGGWSWPDLRGLALLTLLTLVGVPVLRAGASDAGQTVTVQAVATAPTADGSATSLLDDIDADALFEPGASTTDPSPRAAQPPAAAFRSTPPSTPYAPATRTNPASLGDDVSPTSETSPRESANLAAETGSGSSATAVASTAPATTAVTAAPTTAPPTTAAPTTAAPTTAAPTTAAPSTAPPTTAAPTTVPPTTAAPSTAGQPTAEQWAALRQCESGGRYDAVNPIGYYGAYQFSIGTWDSTARRAGRDDLVGVVPSAAAPADQDAMALALWRAAGPGPWPHCGVHLPPRP